MSALGILEHPSFGETRGAANTAKRPQSSAKLKPRLQEIDRQRTHGVGYGFTNGARDKTREAAIGNDAGHF